MTKEPGIYTGEGSLLSKWCWGNGTEKCKRMTLEHYTKLTQNVFKNLNERSKIIKPLLENIDSSKLLDISLRDDIF